MFSGRVTIWRSVLRIIGAFLVGALTIGSDGVAGVPADSIHLRNAEPGVLMSGPGSTVNIAFMVGTTGDRQQELTETLALPEGWRSIVPADESFSLVPGEEELRLFAIRIPPGAPAGLNEVTYSVRTAEDPSFRASVSRTVGVTGLLRLEMAVESLPESVIAGQVYEAVLRTANRGNAALTVSLDVSGNPDYQIEGGPRDFVLDSGEFRLVRLHVQTDGEERSKRRHFLRIRATGEAGELGEATEATTLTVDVLPRATGVTDPFHRIPSQLRVMGAYDDDGNGGIQAEVSGSGPVDETGRRHIEYLLRSPRPSGGGGLRRREEYRFEYFDEWWSFGVGDRMFSLSPLTQRFGYGRGAEVNLHPGPTGMGAYYRQSRFQDPRHRETGAYVMQEYEPVSIRGNILHRTGEDGSGGADTRDRLYSVETRVRPGSGPEVGLEVAQGERSSAETVSDHAVRLVAEGRAAESVYYSLGKIYAGSDYFGAYRDMKSHYGTLRFPVFGNIRGNASYRRHRTNLDRDPERRSTAPQERRYTTGLTYPSPFGTRFTAELNRRERVDLIDPAGTDFESHSIRLGAGHRFDRWGFRNSVESGIIDDRSGDSDRTVLERYDAHLDFFPLTGHRYSLFGRTGHDAFLVGPSRSKSAGVSGRWRVVENLSGRARYTRSWTASDREYEHASGGVSYRLPNRHLVEIDGYWSREATTDDERAGVFVSYTIPFGVPVRRKEGVGTLQGSVLENGEPLADVVVTANGLVAVTDERGRFRFSGLEEDIYTVRLDQRSLGTGRTTAEPMPLVVEIFGRETENIAFDIVETGRIFGQVNRYEFDGERRFDVGAEAEDTRPSLRLAGGLAGVRVEIRNPQKTRSTRTDENGGFAFDQLRPGTWRIRVPNSELPPNHGMAREEIEVELPPGGGELVFLRALPRERRIRLIDERSLD